MPRQRYALTLAGETDYDRLLIEQMNAILTNLSVELGRLQGFDKTTPTFYNDFDMQRKRICNLGYSQREDDACSRAELRKRSVFVNETGEIEAQAPMVTTKGLRGIEAVKFDEVPTLAQTTVLAQGGAGGTVTLTGTQTITGVKTFNVAPLYTATTLSQIVSNVNNYVLGSTTVQRLSTDASRTITGFVAATNAVKIICNVGSFDLVLAHDSGSSSAGNRILIQGGSSLTLTADDAAIFWYDGTTSRWRQIN